MWVNRDQRHKNWLLVFAVRATLAIVFNETRGVVRELSVLLVTLWVFRLFLARALMVITPIIWVSPTGAHDA